MPVDRLSYRAMPRQIGAALRLGWEAARAQLLAVVCLAVVGGVVPVLAAWSLRLLLDSLVEQHVPQLTVTLAVAGIVLCGLVTVAARAAEGYLQTAMHRAIRTVVEVRLFRAIHAVDGLASFEESAKLDQIRLAEQAGESAPQGVIGSGLALVQAGVTAIGFVAAILVLYPWLVLVVAAAAVPTCLLQLRVAKLRADVVIDTSMYHRRLIFYRYLATDVRAAKEIRLFGLGEFFIGRMLRDLGRSNQAEARVERTAAGIELLIGVISGLVTLCGASAAAYLASRHRLTIGDVTVLLAAMVALQAVVGEVTENASIGYRSLLLFSQYLAIAEAQPAAATAAAGVLNPLTDCIEFDDVWFRYSDGLPWVLRGVSCRLPAGQAIGLVGLNGAGKTTMIKLLCRLYEPVRGCIRWDGVDISTIEPGLLRRRISAVFQDFMAYDFTAADNIAVGSLDAVGDEARIRQAAELAGVDDTVQRLPRGYQTMLSRIFPPEEGGSGATLSGGEWQRLALARAFLRQDANILILDEPSSGLDAQVEYGLQQSLGGFRAGRLTLLISHRLSAMNSADLILVLDDGQISERGTPTDLTASGGKYARLFALQAEGYRLPAPPVTGSSRPDA